jgi:hypothetical protein
MEFLKRTSARSTTIVQAIHDEARAEHGNHMICLNNGWMEKE